MQYLTRDPKSTFSHMACITSQLSVRESLKLVILDSGQKHSLSELVTPSSTPSTIAVRCQVSRSSSPSAATVLHTFRKAAKMGTGWSAQGERAA